MAVARAKGSLKGKPPKLSQTLRALLLKLHRAGKRSIAELAELFSIGRAMVYREIARPRTEARSAHRERSPRQAVERPKPIVGRRSLLIIDPPMPKRVARVLHSWHAEKDHPA
jgi:hypothetical protein